MAPDNVCASLIAGNPNLARIKGSVASALPSANNCSPVNPDLAEVCASTTGSLVVVAGVDEYVPSELVTNTEPSSNVCIALPSSNTCVVVPKLVAAGVVSTV